MANATVSKATEKPYAGLLRYLGAREDLVKVCDLPRELTDPAMLNLAWSCGLVEFGRPSWHSEGEPGPAGSPTAAARVSTHACVDGFDQSGNKGWSWTGERRPSKHIRLSQLLAEDAELPAKFRYSRMVANQNEMAVRIGHEQPFAKQVEWVSRDQMVTRIRMTEKGFAALAELL